MAQPKPSYDPKDGPLLSPREELERYREASKRLRERLLRDPDYARELLEEIGYFEMMADEEPESNGTSPADKARTSNGADLA